MEKAVYTAHPGPGSSAKERLRGCRGRNRARAEGCHPRPPWARLPRAAAAAGGGPAGRGRGSNRGGAVAAARAGAGPKPEPEPEP